MADQGLTHGPEELLVQFKGHERAGQVAQPLFEDTGDDVDIVVVQVHTVHIWNGETDSSKFTVIHISSFAIVYSSCDVSSKIVKVTAGGGGGE